eukprot:TRINITY_DN82_c0_g1_i1.p2 TRINITY_DN82_c0_g1~~TRINITY_DN82_c0_g1_i1.p2  ORF type:complete len:312 (+),score=87.47 TRINITY_DN82_c0_g1_i1:26-937(+)
MASAYTSLVKGNDLVARNFYSNGSFAINTETKSGDVSFKSVVSGDSVKPVSAALESKYDWKEHNLVLEGKVTSTNSLTAKATYSKIVPGLSAFLAGEKSVAVKGQDVVVSRSATAGLTYVHEKVHFTTEAKVPVGGNVALTGAVHVRAVDNVSVGLKTDYTVGGAAKFEGKLVGGNNKTEGAVTFNSEKTVGFSLWHSVNAKYQAAATVSVPSAVEGAKVAPTVVNVAGNYKFDDATTLKFKLNAAIDRTEAADHVYRSAISLQQKVNDNVTVSVGTDVNLNHAWGLGASGNASSYGVLVSFK